MTLTTYIYLMIFNKNTYTEITNNLNRRFTEHNNGSTRTTNKFNKSQKLNEIRYKKINNKNYEKTFKHYTRTRKMKYSENWDRWLV